MRILICAPLALWLGGCSLGLPSMTGGVEKNYVSSAPTIPVEAAPVKLVTADSAQPARSRIAVLSLPEPVGAEKKLREKHYINGTRQEIVLDGGPGAHGENVIDVSVRTSSASAGSDTILEIGPPSESGIRNEILSRFPDVRMSIVTRAMRNRFGSYGLAIGRHANGARCIFAWQWIEDLREHTPGMSSFTKLGAMMGNRSMATSIRIRLCRTGMTVDQLAATIDALKVPAKAPVERLASMNRNNLDAPVVSQDGVRRSPLLRPVRGSLESSLGSSPSRSGVERARVAKARAVKAPSKVSRTRRSVSRTRSASNYNRIQHYSASGAPIAPAAVPAPVAAGGKFLAPVNGMNRPPVGAPAPYKPAPGAGLPPAAYRGPQAN